MTPGYLMGYAESLDIRRVEAFFDGKVTDMDDLVALAQDTAESGRIMNLGPNLYRLVCHMVDQRLITVTGMYKQ